MSWVNVKTVRDGVLFGVPGHPAENPEQRGKFDARSCGKADIEGCIEGAITGAITGQLVGVCPGAPLGGIGGSLKKRNLELYLVKHIFYG